MIRDFKIFESWETIDSNKYTDYIIKYDNFTDSDINKIKKGIGSLMSVEKKDIRVVSDTLISVPKIPSLSINNLVQCNTKLYTFCNVTKIDDDWYAIHINPRYCKSTVGSDGFDSHYICDEIEGFINFVKWAWGTKYRLMSDL